MGLHSSFNDVLSEQPISLQALSGKTIGIDAYIDLYQFLASIRDKEGNNYFYEGKNVSHILGYSRKYEDIIKKYNFKLLFVFDGKPLSAKKLTLDKRRKGKKEAETKYNTAKEMGHSEDMKKYSSRINYITPSILKNYKEFILASGQSYVEAPHDAEAFGCKLVNDGVIDYFATQDKDAILYSCDNILRNFGVHNQTKLVSSSRILQELGLTQDQLIYLAIITETDFNTGLYGVGVKTGLKYVRGKTSLQEVLDMALSDIKVVPDSESKEEILKNFELTYDLLTLEPDTSNLNIIEGVLDENKYNTILQEAYSSLFEPQ